MGAAWDIATLVLRVMVCVGFVMLVAKEIKRRRFRG